MKKRVAKVKRKTTETDITVEFNLDGSGRLEVKTGIGFLDHMLALFSKHGLFDLKIKAKGDLGVDLHHTNEDIGITLGEAFKKALGNKKGIERFGSIDVAVPMEEALARIALDISGRPSLYMRRIGKQAPPPISARDSYALNDAKQFLEAFVRNAGVNLHVEYRGEDLHHVLESIFKALGRALGDATRIDARIKGIPSTKGRL